MKIETLTPQIAAMYYGQQCNVIYNAQIIGPSIRKIDCDVIYWLESSSIEILPHLRRLDGLTEAEARELYEIVNHEIWAGEKSCIYNWWEQDFGYEVGVYKVNIGTPTVWIHLLSLGFDLFGLLDAGLAKEITN